MKFETNTKISIVVIICAIISYFFLVNVDSYNLVTTANPVGFDNTKAASITKNDVMIIGNTTIPVNHKIEYGIIGDFSNSVSDDDLTVPHTEHSVKISNLEHDTEYNYRFIVEHENKIYASDPVFFRTIPFDGPMSLIDKE